MRYPLNEVRNRLTVHIRVLPLWAKYAPTAIVPTAKTTEVTPKLNSM
ncbi:hypothetical protein [Polaromonas sp.]